MQNDSNRPPSQSNSLIEKIQQATEGLRETAGRVFGFNDPELMKSFKERSGMFGDRPEDIDPVLELPDGRDPNAPPELVQKMSDQAVFGVGRFLKGKFETLFQSLKSGGVPTLPKEPPQRPEPDRKDDGHHLEHRGEGKHAK